jgi:hypothetical protein
MRSCKEEVVSKAFVNESMTVRNRYCRSHQEMVKL